VQQLSTKLQEQTTENPTGLRLPCGVLGFGGGGGGQVLTPRKLDEQRATAHAGQMRVPAFHYPSSHLLGSVLCTPPRLV
jgi:hypothetical protein